MPSINDTQRKWSAVVLVVLGLIIIAFGFQRLDFLVNSPFLSPFLPVQEELSEEEFLKQQFFSKDTDGDSLNDYDELYVYNTSPYLADSDSDGIDDQEEIKEGKDPNCPGNQDCYGAILEPELEGQSMAGVSDNTEAEGSEAEILKEILPQNPSAEEIRELLMEAGVSAEALNEASDQELIDLYQEILNEF